MSDKPSKSKRVKKGPQLALPSRAEYNGFVTALELVNVVLHSFEGKRLGKLNLTAALGYALEQKSATFENTEGGFLAQVCYSIEVSQRSEDSQISEPVTHTELTMEGVYQSLTPMTDSIFAVFQNTNLPLNLWPYLREMVHTVSMRMGLPSLILPVYHVPTTGDSTPGS